MKPPRAVIPPTLLQLVSSCLGNSSEIMYIFKDFIKRNTYKVI